MNKLWEVGSEFDWSDNMTTSSALLNVLPKTYELFATARSVLFSIHHLLTSHQRRLQLHLPSFFCMETTAQLQTVFDICWYRDLPTEPTPDFNTLCPAPGDVVLAVNLFGIRIGSPWRDWLYHHQDITLIEDHTHDPFSLWAQQSTAHYAMASLRKTLPIPDGAIIWSPQTLELPKPYSSESFGAAQKLTAMLLKQAYLNGAKISKDAYRLLQIQGEKQLGDEINAAASSFTINILQCLNISELRKKREDNIRKFLQLILTEIHHGWKPLFTSWSSETVPFNSILVCKSYEIREALRKFLISQNIFPAVHWEQSSAGISSKDFSAIELSNRILTIPTDHRYSDKDIIQIVEKISEFSHIWRQLKVEK